MNIKEKIRTLKIFRVIVQIIFFIFMPSLFSQAFAGVKEAVALIGKGENLILSDFVIKLLILCTVTIIFGGYFVDLSVHSVLLETGFICSQNLFRKRRGENYLSYRQNGRFTCKN